jgi:hypothetical protein
MPPIQGGDRVTKFLVTYHGVKVEPDPAAQQQMMAAFGQWLAAAGPAVVDPGAPLRMVAQVSDGDAQPAASLGGYSIIQADDQAAAEKILEIHPFLSRGGTLQLNECLPIG